MIVEMESSYLDESAKRLILRRQFLDDLLPWESGVILTSTLKRKGYGTNVWLSTRHLSPVMKGFTWSILIISLLAMLLYTAAVLLRNDNRRVCDAWTLCFLVWVCVDSLLGSTLSAYIYHVVIPYSITSDVKQTQLALNAGVLPTKLQLESVRSKSTSSDEQDGYFSSLDEDDHRSGASGDDMAEFQVPSGQLNAPAFFFASTRIAHYFCQYDTDGLISRYISPWPGFSDQSCCPLVAPIKFENLWQSHTGFQPKVRVRWFGIKAAIGLFSWFPLWQQNLLVCILSTSLSFGLVILHLYLASVSSWLLLAPIGVLSAAFIIWTCLQKNRRGVGDR